MFYLFKTIGVLLLIYINMKIKINLTLGLSAVAVILNVVGKEVRAYIMLILVCTKLQLITPWFLSIPFY